jgi:hypothetical protein
MMVLIHNPKWALWTNSLWMDDGIDPLSKVGLGRIAFGWMMVWIHDHNWALDEYTLDG